MTPTCVETFSENYGELNISIVKRGSIPITLGHINFWVRMTSVFRMKTGLICVAIIMPVSLVSTTWTHPSLMFADQHCFADTRPVLCLFWGKIARHTSGTEAVPLSCFLIQNHIGKLRYCLSPILQPDWAPSDSTPTFEPTLSGSDWVIF